jgi:membrane protease YdiL (CAAX protease family)
VLAEAQRTMAALVAIFLGGLAVGVAGLVLFIIACVRLGSGKLRFAYNAPPKSPRDRIWLETLVVFLVVLLAIGGLVSKAGLIGLDQNTASWILTLLLALFPLWPLWRGVPRAEWRSALGFHKGRGVWREIGAGLIGYLAGVPIFVIGVILTMVIVALTGAELAHPGIEESASQGSFGFLRLLVLACIWAPVVEELIFRGAFFRYMRSRTGTVLSAMIVGFFFAAVHPQGYAAIPALMSLGIVFALLRQWRASIVAPMTAHALHNFMLIGMLFLLLL